MIDLCLCIRMTRNLSERQGWMSLSLSLCFFLLTVCWLFAKQTHERHKKLFCPFKISFVCAHTSSYVRVYFKGKKRKKQWLYSLEESHPLNSWFLWFCSLLCLHHTSPLVKLSELRLWSRIQWHTKDNKQPGKFSCNTASRQKSSNIVERQSLRRVKTLSC